MFTHLIRNASEAAGFRHTVENRGAAFVCADCNEAIYLPCGRSSGGTGYAQPVDSDLLICYPCADKRATRELIGANRAFGYISSDGQEFTTWTGGKLGTVIHHQSTPLPFGRGHGKGYSVFHVRDVHGKTWTGKGSPGVCIRLRPIIDQRAIELRRYVTRCKGV